jgi:hypothetical protein
VKRLLLAIIALGLLWYRLRRRSRPKGLLK